MLKNISLISGRHENISSNLKKKILLKTAGSYYQFFATDCKKA
jgi:hypothetical protein